MTTLLLEPTWLFVDELMLHYKLNIYTSNLAGQYWGLMGGWGMAKGGLRLHSQGIKAVRKDSGD